MCSAARLDPERRLRRRKTLLHREWLDKGISYSFVGVGCCEVGAESRRKDTMERAGLTFSYMAGKRLRTVDKRLWKGTRLRKKFDPVQSFIDFVADVWDDL